MVERTTVVFRDLAKIFSLRFKKEIVRLGEIKLKFYSQIQISPAGPNKFLENFIPQRQL